MDRERDRRVADDRDGAADHPDAERIDHAADDVRIFEQVAVVIEREHLRQHNAFAPGLDERAQRDAEERHDDGDREPQRDRDEGRPAPDAELERRGAQSLAAHRDVALRLLQQLPLHEHERRRDRDDGHDHDRHELIGRHAELVGELVEIGREHQHVLRIAQHERQAEQLEAEEEHQHAGEQDRGQHHRQADVDRDPQRIGADRARRLLDVAAEPAQRRRGVEIDVRHMGEPGDRDQRGQANRGSTARSRSGPCTKVERMPTGPSATT